MKRRRRSKGKTRNPRQPSPVTSGRIPNACTACVSSSLPALVKSRRSRARVVLDRAGLPFGDGDALRAVRHLEVDPARSLASSRQAPFVAFTRIVSATSCFPPSTFRPMNVRMPFTLSVFTFLRRWAMRPGGNSAGGTHASARRASGSKAAAARSTKNRRSKRAGSGRAQFTARRASGTKPSPHRAAPDASGRMRGSLPGSRSCRPRRSAAPRTRTRSRRLPARCPRRASAARP